MCSAWDQSSGRKLKKYILYKRYVRSLKCGSDDDEKNGVPYLQKIMGATVAWADKTDEAKTKNNSKIRWEIGKCCLSSDLLRFICCVFFRSQFRGFCYWSSRGRAHFFYFFFYIYRSLLSVFGQLLVMYIFSIAKMCVAQSFDEASIWLCVSVCECAVALMTHIKPQLMPITLLFTAQNWSKLNILTNVSTQTLSVHNFQMRCKENQFSI